MDSETDAAATVPTAVECPYDCQACRDGAECRTCYECDAAWAKENFGQDK